MKKQLYKYSAFGLKIDSEFMLPELENGNGDADVIVETGEIDTISADPDVTYRLSKNEFAFNIKNLATYSIQNGNRIIVQLCENADLPTVRAYLLGICIGILLIQKNLVPIHGSAIVFNDKAILLTGNCGAGKTTLSSWFLRNGYRFLSDDICAISFDKNGMPLIQPGFSQQRINSDTAMALNLDVKSLPIASLHDDKYIINPKNLFFNQPIPLLAIIEIVESEIDEVEMKKVKGINTLHYFMENIYCYLLYKDIGFDRDFFNKCMRIIEQIEVYCLLRPKNQFTPQKQMEMIIDTF